MAESGFRNLPESPRNRLSAAGVFLNYDGMNMAHVFLSDVDGTLVNRDTPLTRPVLGAARAYREKGGLLSLCTGRSVIAAQATAEALGVNLPCILYGGASIYDFHSSRHLRIHSFQYDILSSVRQVLTGHPDISMQVFTQDDIYVLRRNARLNRRGVAEENTGSERAPEDVHGEIIKLVMCCDDVSALASCAALFPKEYCEFAFSSRYFVDITPKGCSKADAMHALSEHTGIPLSSFFAAGDSMADLPMLSLAGISFAPANATDAVKEAVTHIVPGVNEGGMAQAFSIAAEHL